MAFGLIIQRRLGPSGVSGMLRNGWPESIGMPGRNESEQVSGIGRNQCPAWPGIRIYGLEWHF